MKVRRSIPLLIAALLVFLLAGCSSQWHYDPITDVNNLEGRRVGVNLAWESDYYLTGRQDLELYRYDQTADMIMALSYDKIDALAIDALGWANLANLSDGVERTEPVGYLNYIMYLGADDKELGEDINSFLKDFKQTAEYQDLVDRMSNFDGVDYVGPDIPLTGTGKVLHVVLDPMNYPRSFPATGTDEAIGYDLEPLKYYANDRGYQLDFTLAEYNAAVIGLQNGSYDVFVGYLSDVYAEDVISVGLYVTDPMFSSPLYFVQKTRERISVETEAL